MVERRVVCVISVLGVDWSPGRRVLGVLVEASHGPPGFCVATLVKMYMCAIHCHVGCRMKDVCVGRGDYVPLQM